MTIRRIQALTFTVTTLALVVLLAPAATRAHTDSSQQNEAQRATSRSAAERAREEAKRLAEQRAEAENSRRSAARSTEQPQDRLKFKQACEARLDTLNRRMDIVGTGLRNRATALDTAVDRIRSFVASRKLTVANYDALLLEAEAQHLLIETLATAAKERAAAFDCTSAAAARNSAAAFADTIHDQIDALGSYKSAVKALIAAVKTAAQAAEGANAR